MHNTPYVAHVYTGKRRESGHPQTLISVADMKRRPRILAISCVVASLYLAHVSLRGSDSKRGVLNCPKFESRQIRGTLLESYELPPPLDWETRENWRGLLDEVILPGRQTASWNTYYSMVCDLIRKHPSYRKRMRIIEIGTAYGGNADSLASCFPHSTIVAVDPLLPAYDTGDAHSNALSEWAKARGLSPDEFSKAWGTGLLYDQQLKHGCRYHLLRGDSISVGKALLSAGIEVFDVAFIDGLHTYEGVRRDLSMYKQLVKDQGLMIFNDYNTSAFPGVTRAVDEFVRHIHGVLIVGDEKHPPGITNAAVTVPA